MPLPIAAPSRAVVVDAFSGLAGGADIERERRRRVAPAAMVVGVVGVSVDRADGSLFFSANCNP